MRVTVPPRWHRGQEDNGVTSFTGKIPEGRVVPLGRWRDIRGRGTLKPLHLATYHFGSGLTASLARLNITAFISTSLELTHLQTACPRPPYDAGSRRVPSRVHDRLESRGYVVAQASHQRVTPIACCASRPLAEQGVTSSVSFRKALQIIQMRRIAPAPGSASCSRQGTGPRGYRAGALRLQLALRLRCAPCGHRRGRLPGAA